MLEQEMSFSIVFCKGKRASTKQPDLDPSFCQGLPHENDENMAAASARREGRAPGVPTIIIL